MKTAAIWWRVSTDDQKEISPDTQGFDMLRASLMPLMRNVLLR